MTCKAFCLCTNLSIFYFFQLDIRLKMHKWPKQSGLVNWKGQRSLAIYPRTINVSPRSTPWVRTLYFCMNCLGIVFSHTLHLAREDDSRNRRQLRSMFCINFTNSLICYNLARLLFSDCLVLAKSLIIKCSEILSDLGYGWLNTLW